MPQSAEVAQIDVKDMVLSNGPFGPNEVTQLQAAIAHDSAAYHTLRDAVGQLEQKPELTPASKVRLGVCFYLMGRFGAAIECLSSADGGALARFYLAKSCFATEAYEKAIEHYNAAAQAGYNSDDCALGRAECLRYQGDTEGALKVLDQLSGAVEQTAEYLAQRTATVSKLGALPSEVVALYERAVQVNEEHPAALFGLAMENDRYGNDNVALDLYRRATNRLPAHIGSLLNLGVLYEDRNQYTEAQRCYQRILDIFPDHARARLYLKDSMASTDQVFDEDAVRQRDRLAQVLNIPVTDFELSVRSRNCLQRMGLITLGDLTRISEQQLLGSKNFGETSLVEIQDMMQSKGLDIGQFAVDRGPGVVVDYGPETPDLSPDEQALLNKPVADLNLSVRARKCMIRLGISTIGELVRRTGDELLECKNFGVTSLNEVREKLTIQSLKLRGD